MSVSPQKRYVARFDELLSLEVELEGGKRPGGPAPLVGQLLEAAGDLLRRSAVLGVDRGLVDRALGRVSGGALGTFGTSVEVGELEGRLRRAANHAVEVAIPDEPDEVETAASWAMQGLLARDRLESVLFALDHLASLGRQDAGRMAGQMREGVAAVDARCRPTAVALTPLNAYRRAEAVLLDEGERAKAWWFSSRSGIEDDLLVPILGGQRQGTLPEAERDANEVVMSRRTRSISSDDLWRFDLALASEDERKSIRRRAEEDPELRLALVAIEEGERAIDELTSDPVPELARSRIAAPTERAEVTPDVLEENQDFRVLIFRGPRSVQVVVRPHQPRRLAAAAVFRSEDQGVPLAPVTSEQGLEFDLGSPERLRGQVARLIVKMVDGQSHALEVQL
jgi:hypothetical protein